MIRKVVQNKYNISDATLRNWKKLKYIDSLTDINEQQILNVINNKKSSRRNKKISLENIIPSSYVNDSNIYYIIKKIINIKKMYNINDRELLHEMIIKLLAKKYNSAIELEISKTLNERTNNESFIKEIKKIKLEYDFENDFIGCLYMSLISIGSKDINGIFYTPYEITNEIINMTKINKDDKILDPGCGSGNFLIQAFKKMKELGYSDKNIMNRLYGYDIDEIAVLLAKINLYNISQNVKFSDINIYCKDFLEEPNYEKFSLIIGNPPWGKKYNIQEKNNLEKKYDKFFSNLDSFSQFIILSMEKLEKNGCLEFVLPSSILNIVTHKYIRNYLLQYKINNIKIIGRKFKEIVTDVIIIKVTKSNNKDNFVDYDGRKVAQNIFNESIDNNFLVSNQISQGIIKKIRNSNYYHLINDVKFGLGIVTGNNEKCLLDKKEQNAKKIISGKELTKYNIDYSNVKKYIDLYKNKPQQMAPIELYNTKNKILYKFIGKKLTFSVDVHGILNLNSANMICLGEEYDPFYVSAILNSRITQLFFDECYCTFKILKRHIQSFYIIKCNLENEKRIIELSKNTLPNRSYNEMIEEIIYGELKLNKKEIEYLRKHC